MTEHVTPVRRKRHLAFVIAYLLAGLFTSGRCSAQDGTLAEPFPAPAPNAALHYQRALLHLAKLDDDQAQLLSKPIWEVLPVPVNKQLPREVNSLLRRGRFAVRSAATGSRTAECNFGIDFSELGAAAQLPHVEGMVHLGRLLTLRGAHAEARGARVRDREPFGSDGPAARREGAALGPATSEPLPGGPGTGRLPRSHRGRTVARSALIRRPPIADAGGAA